MNESIIRKSEGGMLIYELANQVRDESGLSFSDTDNVHECVDIYDTYLAKGTNKKLDKLEKMTKRRVKKIVIRARSIKDIYEKRKMLSTILYILSNLENIRKYKK